MHDKKMESWINIVLYATASCTMKKIFLDNKSPDKAFFECISEIGEVIYNDLANPTKQTEQQIQTKHKTWRDKIKQLFRKITRINKNHAH